MVFEIPPTSAAATPRPLWLGIGGVMLALLVACLVGILSRIGNFPAFWPANAVLLGLLLRHAHLARRPVTWACMWLVYVLADLVTGASLFVALTLNTANIVGVLCGWLFLYRQGIQKQGFQRQRAVLVMFCGCLLYAVSSALVGTWPSHVAFGTPLWRVLLMWIATEFCNCVLVLPVILSAPRGWVWQWKSPVNFHSWHYVLPLGALLLTEVLSRVFHGPGSVAFVIPSLVWCGLAYGVFATAVINFVFGIAKLLAVSLGALVVYSPDNVMDVASFRAGLSLLTLAPLAVASIQVLHNQTLQRLKQAVNHDFLTGALARRAFMDRGQKLLARLQQESRSVAVLMVDLDHFKQINDRFGHAQGDVVLQKFVELGHAALRPGDLLGRMGGEEFALVLPDADAEQAQRVGQRIGGLMREHPFELDDGQVLHVTVSMGVCAVSAGQRPIPALEVLLSCADKALYRAKESGRDSICCMPPPQAAARAAAA